MIAGLLGNSPTKITQRYKDSSPLEMLPIGRPQILIYGSDDLAVPAKLGEEYMKVARQQGDKVKLIIVQHAGHHEYNAPNSIAWPAVKAAVFHLMNDH